MKLLCFALAEEATACRQRMAGRPDVIILVTGMGRRNAETALRQFLQTQTVELVLTCGFAGGLDPKLAAGAVVCETADAALAARLQQAGAQPGKIYCADRVAVTAADKAALRASTGQDAVEMESGAIQSVCAAARLPCAAVRVISDTAGEDLPLDFNRLYRPDMTLDFGKLGRTIALAPWKIPALMRLQKRCQFAAEKLAEVVAKVV
jgi:adenosylhomocysteine nucleosidase